MEDPRQWLRQLGFGEYEARAYVELLKCTSLTGYEVAKASGVPRANIYGVLQKLEERGAVVRLQSSPHARYAAVAASTLISRLKGRMNLIAERAAEALLQVDSTAQDDPLVQSRGYPGLLEQARVALDTASRCVLFAGWRQESAALAHESRRAQARGVQVTTICVEGCAEPCGHCQGTVFRRYVLPPIVGDVGRWLLVIRDNEELVIGVVSGSGEALAVHTRKPILVALAGSAVCQNVAVATIMAEAGDCIRDALRPSTVRALEQLVSTNKTAAGWLAHLRPASLPEAS